MNQINQVGSHIYDCWLLVTVGIGIASPYYTGYKSSTIPLQGSTCKKIKFFKNNTFATIGGKTIGFPFCDKLINHSIIKHFFFLLPHMIFNIHAVLTNSNRINCII